MVMNTSRYVVEYLRDYGVKYAFGVIGSAMYRIFQALGEVEGIDYVCPLHEQGASMGADGYARSAGTLGVCIATCGPGTTNVMTGCAGAYTDSIPILYLVGYPNTNGTKQDMPIRHLAYQEFDIVNMFQPITKYVTLVEKAEDIKYELMKAISLATTGRKGPVMLVLPENVMFSDVDTALLRGYEAEDVEVHDTNLTREAAEYCFELLKNSAKPLLLFGGGVRCASAVDVARELSSELGCPTAMTYPMRDMLDYRDPLNTTSVGIFGTRAGNFAVQASDVLIGIGTRMETFLTGNAKNFAAKAKKVVIDIDRAELDKLPRIGLDTEKRYCIDAKRFIEELLNLVRANKKELPNFIEWIDRLNAWKEKYPVVDIKFYKEEKTNPYVFFKRLSDQMGDTDRLVVGSGLACSWVGQSFDFKMGQRWIMQYSIGAMGYGLPAAIGASFATDDRIVMVTGDGSLQMSINELATIELHHKNVKIFVICNEAYGLIQKTQDDWNCGHYATDREHHVAIPDSAAIAETYGLPTFHIYRNQEIQQVIKDVFSVEGPAFCSVHIPIENKISLRAKGGRLDNLFPYLPEEIIEKELED